MCVWERDWDRSQFYCQSYFGTTENKWVLLGFLYCTKSVVKHGEGAKEERKKETRGRRYIYRERREIESVRDK